MTWIDLECLLVDGLVKLSDCESVNLIGVLAVWFKFIIWGILRLKATEIHLTLREIIAENIYIIAV